MSRLDRRTFLWGLLGLAGAQLGCGAPGTATPTVGPLPFDRRRAWGYLLRQVAFGPRVPGTAPHSRCRDFLLRELRATLGSASPQAFSFQGVQMCNILSQYHGGGEDHVLLCAHWDTRPRADNERDPDRRRLPIPGANDGASGVAVLLEIAHALQVLRPPIRLSFALFDGEDWGPDEASMYLGSRHYASTLPQGRPSWGVLLDMVGDRDLRIPREGFSEEMARAVNDRVWAAARLAGHGDVFVEERGASILDDHLPLLRRGIPVVDVIDFDYPHWHTLRDDPSACRPHSLEVVGRTILTALTREL